MRCQGRSALPAAAATSHALRGDELCVLKLIVASATCFIVRAVAAGLAAAPLLYGPRGRTGGRALSRAACRVVLGSDSWSNRERAGQHVGFQGVACFAGAAGRRVSREPVAPLVAARPSAAGQLRGRGAVTLGGRPSHSRR
eukprot:CAMPEP_0206797722 /NCGR_PEP_ID=MMETSP0975-20121206/302_1 /ASSEMBLY_ACC=CAM_ASM_000399 /TAXON_ID=483370 /ORGANISM="non described non described, Strain CCMP2097" /LENGTH=140 /DNA_ID=CAMNT_0054339649 /DNA_START=45 /DNA_END=468 /DNA_ORIENTATION=-